MEVNGTKIGKKLVSIMQECSYVVKNGVNSYHNYKYATAENVLLKVNEAMGKNKVASVVVPELTSVADVTTAKGNTEHLATVEVSITLIDSESGETLTFKGIGSGQDAGDKAIMKAQTAAIKYAYMMTLCIVTGDDPEADGETDRIAGTDKEGEKVRTSSVKADNKGVCADCGCCISERVADFSMKKFGTYLCMDCQKTYKQTA